MIELNTDAYSLNGALTCYAYDCIVENQTGSSIVIKASPLSSSTTLIMEGLLSSPTTVYGEQVANAIASYSAQNNKIDEGSFTYTISCSDISPLNCKTCINGGCISCYVGYYLYQTQCTTNCSLASSFTAYPSVDRCENCASPCLLCTTVDSCISCVSGYYLYENSSCLFTCDTSQGYYALNNECNKCPQNCLYCESADPNYCFTCAIGFSNNGVCTTTCPSGTYSSSSQCLNCDDGCISCFGPSSFDCIECKADYLNISGSCEGGCPVGTVQIGNSCGCEGNCSSCEGTATTCTQCISSFPFLYNGNCFTACPQSTYFIGTVCYSCSSGCFECTRTTCLQCSNGLLLYDNKCYSDCNSLGQDFSAVDGRCIQCQDNCDECDASYNCLLCLESFTLTNGTCQLTCELTNTC